MARVNLVDLPVEILDLILGPLSKNYLKRLCLVSKNVSQLAQHYLYNDNDLIQKKEADCATSYIGNIHVGVTWLLRRQARTVKFLSEPGRVRKCITAPTQKLGMDLSSLATPRSWMLDMLTTLFDPSTSEIERFDLILPESRLADVLPILLDAPRVRDINLWLLREEEIAEELDYHAFMLVFDLEKSESKLFLGDIPFYERKGNETASKAKIVSITLADSPWNSAGFFVARIISLWPAKPVIPAIVMCPNPPAPALRQQSLHDLRIIVDRGSRTGWDAEDEPERKLNRLDTHAKQLQHLAPHLK